MFYGKILYPKHNEHILFHISLVLISISSPTKRSFTNHVKLDVRVKYFVLDHTNKKVLCKCTHNCQSPLIKFYQRCSIKSVDSPPVLNLDWQHFPDLWRKHQRQHFSELSTYIDMLHICQQSCAISEHRYVDKICSFFFQ